MHFSGNYGPIALIVGHSLANLIHRQDDSSNFNRRFFHGSFILDKTLYIDGGEYSWQNGSSIAQEVLNQTLVISLDQSFDSSATQASINPAVINKGDCPSLNQVRFWYAQNDTSAFAYGGEWSQLHPWLGPSTVPPNDLWHFVPLSSGSGGSWEKLDTIDNGGWQRLLRSAGNAVASDNGTGYALGGYLDSWTDQSEAGSGGSFEPSPGLQICNLTANQCSIDSAMGYVTNGTFELGGLVHVPFWGQQGLVLVVGGQTSPTLDTFTNGQKYQDMKNISIFEPVERRWYYQTAVGDIPTPRDRFCIVGASEDSGKNNTFEIFMYGGSYGSAIFSAVDQVPDELYVLSLPAFQWFKANYTPTDNRILHTCHGVGRQLLSIGGVDPSMNSFQAAIEDSDRFVQGMKVFDMTAMQWTNKWDSSMPAYQKPNAIKSFYASTIYGPAQWDMSELQAIFNGTAAYGSSGSGHPSNKSPGKRHIGAIVGGVIGGVMALAAVGLGAYYILFWRRRGARSPSNGKEIELGVPEGLAEDQGIPEMSTVDQVITEMSGETRKVVEVEALPAEMSAKDAPRWEMPTEDEPQRPSRPAELP